VQQEHTAFYLPVAGGTAQVRAGPQLPVLVRNAPMISEKFQCIFVHVPKTAGQSVELAFLNEHGLSWEQRGPLLLKANSDPSRGPERLAHLTAREYVQLGHMDAERFSRFYKFAFVRNPWARLVSEYQYRFEHKGSFASFVTRSIPARETFSDFSRHIIPQVDYLVDGDGAYIVDFVGRFEHLAGDFAHVAGQVGLGCDVLPHRNKAGEFIPKPGLFKRLFRQTVASPVKKPYQEFYTSDLRDFVGEYYAEDARRFGCSFDGTADAAPIIRPEGARRAD